MSTPIKSEKKEESSILRMSYNAVSRLLLVGMGIAIGAALNANTVTLYKRDDSPNNDNNNNYDDKNSSSNIVSKILNNTAFRVALVFIAILLINMIAICIHHIYHRVTSNSKSYRNIERVISPF